MNFVLMDTKIFQEFKDELPPRYDSWVDWYLDSRAMAKEKGWEFNNDSVFRYDFYPLADAYHDMSARHIYSTTVGFMRAKIFEEMELFSNKHQWRLVGAAAL